MAYTLPDWSNKPSTATPLSAANLLALNSAIDDLDSRLSDVAAAGGILYGFGPPAVVVAGVTGATSNDAYVDSLDINTPENTVDGDVLLLFDCNDGLTPISTPPDGWELIDQSVCGGDGILEAGVWIHVASGEPLTYTVTPDASCIMTLAMVRCIGVNTAMPIRDHSVTLSPDDASPSPAPTAPSGASAADRTVVCYGWGDRDGTSDAAATLAGPDDLWTTLVEVGTLHAADWNCALVVADAPGTTTPASATPSRTGSWVIQSVTLASANSDIGVDGDFYLDRTNQTLYGPKDGDTWGDGIQLSDFSSGVVGSVVGFGAVGDGVTDDTLAIQTALDTLGAAFLPAPQVAYLVSSTLTCSDRWQNQFSLTGESLGQVTINYTGTGPFLQLDPSATPSNDTRRNFWHLSGFTVNGPGAGVADTIGILVNNALAGSMQDVQVNGFDVGVKFDGLGLVNDTACYYNAAINVQVNDCGSVAVWFAGQANTNQMFGGQANSSAIGVKVDSTTNNVNLHGTNIESNTTYGVVVGGYGNQFLGCRFENPDATAEVKFDDTGSGDGDGTKNTILSYFSDDDRIETIEWDTDRNNSVLWPGKAYLGSAKILMGAGDPEGSIVARPGDLYLRSDGSSGSTVYAKGSGTDTDTGWGPLLAASANTPVALSGTSPTVDASLGNVFTLTMTGNTTMGNPSNSTDAQMILFKITSGGAHTMTWGSNYSWGADITVPTLSQTSGKIDYVGFTYDSTAGKWHGLAVARGY